MIARLREDEAKTKWCPFARTFDGVQTETIAAAASVSRQNDGSPFKPCLCIASACMAWRWIERLENQDLEDIRGYCGLAGRPA